MELLVSKLYLMYFDRNFTIVTDDFFPKGDSFTDNSKGPDNVDYVESVLPY